MNGEDDFYFHPPRLELRGEKNDNSRFHGTDSRGGKQCEQSFHKRHNLVPSQLGLSVHSVHEGNWNLSRRDKSRGENV